MMLHISRSNIFTRYLRLLSNVQKLLESSTVRSSYYATSIDAMDSLTVDIILRKRAALYPIGIRYFMESDKEPRKEISDMTSEELDSIILQLLSKQKYKKIENIMLNLTENRAVISEVVLKKLLRFYSLAGKPEIVEVLQNYCSKVYPILHKRNGHYQHYLAKAQCLKGNSEKGLLLLKNCYERNEGFRSLYRIILRELIQDSVLNRSEASMVIFRKYVILFSEKFQDHYPLVCLWHLCWASTWFSDQVVSEELLDQSAELQDIVKNKATAFTVSVLKYDYNEDAVLRLLQSLLKYHLMTEYTKVLQVLFNYKLRNRDIRGCAEILRNCEILGITLPADQQGRYIRMLIDGKTPTKDTPKQELKDFKLKF